MPTYHPDKEKLDKPYKRALPIVGSKSGGKDSIITKNININGSRKYKLYTHKTPIQLLEISRDKANKGIHPTQKPVALFEQLIRTYTNEKDIILDSFIGSGTTAIAAINTNRKWIGIEKDRKCFEMAKNRIQEHSQKKK